MPGGRRRATLTLADQCVSSLSNFTVGIVAARLAGARGLGVFTLAYAAWLLLASMHRSLITDPMAIEGDARGPSKANGVASGLAAELILGVGASAGCELIGAVLYMAGAHDYGVAFLAVMPWLPVLLAQDYWRWVAFMSASPGKALANDIVFDVVQGAAFVLLLLVHVRSPVVIFAAWGGGAFAGAFFGLWQHGLLRRVGGPAAVRDLPRAVSAFFAGGQLLLWRRWAIGRYIAGNQLMAWGSSQAFVFIAGITVGTAGLGGLNAAQTLVTGPTMVLIQAGGSIGLPEASRAYAERGWAGLLRVSRVITVSGVLSVAAGTLVIAMAGRFLLTTVYGPQFAHFETAAVLFGIGQTLSMLGLGPILILKATRNPHLLMLAMTLAFIVSGAGVALLSVLYGVNGAAAAYVAAGAVTAVGLRWFQRRVRCAAAPAGRGSIPAAATGAPAFQALVVQATQ